MGRTIVILTILLTCWFPLLVMRVSEQINDASVSAEAHNWVVVELVFHGLALGLLWAAIITGD